MQAVGHILPFPSCPANAGGEATSTQGSEIVRDSTRIIDAQNGATWNSLIAQFPNATPFHSWAWISALADAYGFRPLLIAFGQEESPSALLPVMEVKSLLGGSRAIGLPFTDSCRLLVRDCEFSRAASVLTQWLSSFKSCGWSSLELRGCDVSGVAPSEQFLTHDLDLTVGEAALWAACSSANQRNIANARKSGVTVRQDNSLEAVRSFYRLQCRTRRKHGLPPQPFSFFRSIHEHVLAKAGASLYLAENANCCVTGALFLHAGRQVIYKYGASDERALGLRANNLLMWKAIAEYAMAGFQNLNFGRTELFNDGLRRYKMAFGSREQSLRYHCFDFRMKSFVQSRGGKLHRLARPIFRRLPLTAGRLAGALLYRFAA